MIATCFILFFNNQARQPLVIPTPHERTSIVRLIVSGDSLPVATSCSYFNFYQIFRCLLKKWNSGKGFVV